MILAFSKSCQGYSHLKSGLPCQDYSLSYHDEERTIIACCDGHGGKAYIRSDRGSRFAATAILNVFSGIAPRFLKKYKGKEAEDRIRMALLCEWNKLVERDIYAHSFSKKELENLDEETRDELLLYKTKAYGSTMSGALLLEGKLVIASIGDTECLLMKKREVERPLSKDSDPAGNITYSLCQDNAYEYIRVRVLDFRHYDAVILCTDGFSSPYQSYDNLNRSFLRPTLKRAIEGKSLHDIDGLIVSLAKEIGTGDDVSLSYIIDTKSSARHYK